MLPDEVWDDQAAQDYDTPGEGMFAPAVILPAVDFLAELAGDGAALEFAIGTGRIAVPLAARGVPVSGIDSSPAMIARLRSKAAIPVVVGDMTTASVPEPFALVFVVYNAIPNLLTQEAQVACFRNAARHLAPGGRPSSTSWASWPVSGGSRAMPTGRARPSPPSRPDTSPSIG
jgi:SAM-dependent methyltransferase